MKVRVRVQRKISRRSEVAVDDRLGSASGYFAQGVRASRHHHIRTKQQIRPTRSNAYSMQVFRFWSDAYVAHHRAILLRNTSKI